MYMPIEQQQMKVLQRHTRGLMEEARTYMTASPEIWAITMDRWSKLNPVRAENKIWLSELKAESFHVGLMVFHRFSTTIGTAFAVQPYDTMRLGSTEYMMIFERSIPTALHTRISSGLKAVRWYSHKAAGDPFLQRFMNAMNEAGDLEPPLHGDLLSYANQWIQKIKTIRFLLPFTMQLIPLDNQRTLFIFKRTYDEEYGKVNARIYHVGEFLLLAQNLMAFLEDFHLPANFVLKPELPVPTWSVLPFPELADSLPSQGQKVPLPQHGAEPYMHLQEGLSPEEGFRQTHHKEMVQCQWCKKWFLPAGERCPFCDRFI
jgi:hypothetical protein